MARLYIPHSICSWHSCITFALLTPLLSAFALSSFHSYQVAFPSSSSSSSYLFSYFVLFEPIFTSVSFFYLFFFSFAFFFLRLPSQLPFACEPDPTLISSPFSLATQFSQLFSFSLPETLLCHQLPYSGLPHFCVCLVFFFPPLLTALCFVDLLCLLLFSVLAKCFPFPCSLIIYFQKCISFSFPSLFSTSTTLFLVSFPFPSSPGSVSCQ